MRDYPFSFQDLDSFSNSLPYSSVKEERLTFLNDLNVLKKKYNFPAINNNIGEFISMMVPFWKPEVIFEMGSGYGHSCFWYLNGDKGSIKEIILTEKRDDLEKEFHHLDWPDSWKHKIKYFQQDAFEVLEKYNKIDLALIDGVKGDYLKFLQLLETKLTKNGVVLIDNSYWRGSFLDERMRETKKSARNIYELHEYIKNSNTWNACFIPYVDGLTILTLNENI
jgi:predicted O-methyltransferase YrrM